MGTSTCSSSHLLLLALLVFVTSQGNGAYYSPQSRICTDYSSKCGGKQIFCPRQCPTFKASTEKGKGCFIDCNARDCEAICKSMQRLVLLLSERIYIFCSNFKFFFFFLLILQLASQIAMELVQPVMIQDSLEETESCFTSMARPMSISA